MTDPNPRYADACPACPRREVLPGSGIAVGGCLTAAYRCLCGHPWTCTWALVTGRALPPQPQIGEAA